MVGGVVVISMARCVDGETNLKRFGDGGGGGGGKMRAAPSIPAQLPASADIQACTSGKLTKENPILS